MFKIYQLEDGSRYLYDHRTGTFYSIAMGSPYRPCDPEYWLSGMEVVGEVDSLYHAQQMNEQETLKEVMKGYESLRTKWIEFFGEDEGFNEWFTTEIFAK